MRRVDDARVKPYVDADGRLTLAKLLAVRTMKVGVSNARSYGATIDELLNPYKGKSNLFINASGNPAKSLMQMELAGRVDVVPGFPYEAAYLGMDTGVASTAIRFYPLVEQPGYILGHAVCAKSKFGAAVIRKIDTILNRRKVRDASPAITNPGSTKSRASSRNASASKCRTEPARRNRGIDVINLERDRAFSPVNVSSSAHFQGLICRFYGSRPSKLASAARNLLSSGASQKVVSIKRIQERWMSG